MFIVLLIGVLNLGLGFVAAIHLGYGPPSLSAAWQTWTGNAATISGKHVSSDNGDSDADDLSALGFDEEDLDSLLDIICPTSVSSHSIHYSSRNERISPATNCAIYSPDHWQNGVLMQALIADRCKSSNRN